MSTTLHSNLGPSKAEQWVNCPRSVSFIEEVADRLPPDEGSVYATEGTLAHEVAAAAIATRLGMPAVDVVAPPGVPWPGDELNLYIDECVGLGLAPGHDVYLEEKVPLWYKPEDTGTVDFAAVSDGGIHVRDLKWGAGEFVDHVNNKQLAIYGWAIITHLAEMGLYHWGEDTPVTIGIVQPRYRGEEKVRIWSTTVGELRSFVLPITAAADLINGRGGVGDFNPTTKGCRWCRAKTLCPARNAALDELPPWVLVGDASDLLPDLTDRGPLTDGQIVRILQAAPQIEDIISGARSYAFDRAAAGTPLEGTKLVLGRQGNREWADEAAADKFLTAAKLKADQRYVQKLVSVAQAEKLLKPLEETRPKLLSRFSSLVHRLPAKTSIALADDPRPAIADLTEVLPTLTDEDNG